MQYYEAINLKLGDAIQLNGKVEQIIRTKSFTGQDVPTFMPIKVEGIEPILYMRVDIPLQNNPC
ncbi:hypothetical protein COO91_08350 [Nostoc flagelliforme CCNUN1]|uniref:Uncharacterized protein n=1 Tax=Nostoc flagelliforme CCNUN1 TaxID=2038116 RepID=A0A2K8T3E2_9NOSO|nr:hypothetical protein [Nostoc flagelliforme]AUB42238.1 hypothetical protein COO91_08350 [Nostoc flagelliforme CCNUN1]